MACLLKIFAGYTADEEPRLGGSRLNPRRPVSPYAGRSSRESSPRYFGRQPGAVDEEGLPVGLTLEMGRLVPRRKSTSSQGSANPTPGGASTATGRKSDTSSYFSYT